MSRKKNIGIGLGCLVFFLTYIFSSIVYYPPSVSAQASLDQKALEACAKLYGIEPKDYTKFSNTTEGKECTKAFKIVYQDGSQSTFDSVCASKPAGSPAQAACLNGRKLGKEAREADNPTPPAGGGGLTDAQIKAIAQKDSACQVGAESLKNACVAGFVAGYKGASENVCNNSSYNTREETFCHDGYDAGKEAKRNGISQPDPTNTQAIEDGKEACKDYAPGGSKANNTYYNFCINGYVAGVSGKSRQVACEDGFVANSASQKACLVGFNAAKETSAGDDTSDCIKQGSTSLEWILCPFTSALGKTAENMNDFIENQLRFNSNDFLPESGNNNGIYKAWAIIKNLVSSVLIILLLVMVISQAIGNGVFEAYTVRKVLPRLIIAVIAMQLSWEICKFFIDLANDLGNGIANLITAPFGGAGNMDLNSVLSRMGDFFSGTANVGIAAALVAGGVIAISNPAGALLIAFTIVLAVLTALATILFRNIIIIVCVMLSPLAILLWVLPMKGLHSYWDLWRDNFTKALLLFPLMAAVIYAGRIFAWIVAGLDGPGFIDFIMVVVGFFGPYYLLPSMFKRGGSLMSSGYGAIQKGGNVFGKKPKEYFGHRKEEYGKARKLQSQQRVAEGRPSFIRGDHFRSGKFDPMYLAGGTGKKLREAKVAAYEAGGAHSFEEENKHFEQSIEAREKGLNERFSKVYRKTDGTTTTDADDKGIERDKYNRKVLVESGDKDDLVQAIAAKDSSIKFSMVDGKKLTIAEMFGHVSDEHVEAALGRMASLGGSPNLTQLDNEISDMMKEIDDAESTGKTTPEIIEKNKMLNRFLGRTAGNMFGKMPHWYKGIPGAAEGLNIDQLAGVSGASMKTMLDTLSKDANSTNADTKKKATKALAALARTWGEAVDNPNFFGRIDKKSRQSLGDFLSKMDPIKAGIIRGAGDVDEQKLTENALLKLSSQITPGGDLRDNRSAQQAAASAQAAQTAQATQQQTTPNTQGTPSQTPNQAPTTAGTSAAGVVGGAAVGAATTGGGGGERAGGSTYTGSQGESGLNKVQMTEAMVNAIEQTGLGRRSSEPGTLQIPHGSQQGPGQVITPTTPAANFEGPNIPIRGQSSGGVILPQERRGSSEHKE